MLGQETKGVPGRRPQPQLVVIRHTAGMRSLALIVLTTMAASPAFAADDMQPRRLLGGLVTLLVPADLVEQQRDEEENATGPWPSIAFGNADLSVALAAEHILQFELKPTDVGTLVDTLRRMFTNSKIIRSGIRRIGGFDFAVLEAEVAPPAYQYVITAQTSYADHLFFVTYTCTPDKDAGCADRGRRVIESIRLRQ
ncbi:MAG TPA: hypothetical protein VFP37_10835 [Steroidobacteraceae bacterium]|nr:hypothetical protein [Steroidobacteraceae bacterium]